MAFMDEIMKEADERLRLTKTPVPLPRPQLSASQIQPGQIVQQPAAEVDAGESAFMREIMAEADARLAAAAAPQRETQPAAIPIAPRAETAPAAPAAAQNAPSTLQQIVTSLTPASVGRGASKLQAETALANAFWYGNVDELKRFEKESKDVAAWGFDPEIEKARLKWMESDAWGGWDALWENPKLAATLLGESLPSLALPIAGGAVGALGGAATGPAAPIAGPVGAVVGTAAGIFGTRMGSDLRDFLKSKEVDPDDPEQLMAAWSDPEIQAGARAYMVKKAGSASLVEAALGGVVGKFARPLLGGGRVAQGTAVAVGGEALGAGIAGQAGNLAVGEPLSMRDFSRDVLMEVIGGGVLEAAPSLVAAGFTPPVQPATTAVLDRVRPQPAPPPSLQPTPSPARPEVRMPPVSVPEIPSTVVPRRPEVRMPGPVPAPVPRVQTPEEAEAEGRTAFVYVEDGKVKSAGRYDVAEEVAGASDTRKGRLIAVRPEELEAPSYERLRRQYFAKRFDWAELPSDLQNLWRGVTRATGKADFEARVADFEAVAKRPERRGDLVAAGARLDYKGPVDRPPVAFRQVAYAGLRGIDPDNVQDGASLETAGGTQDIDLNKLRPGDIAPAVMDLWGLYESSPDFDAFARRYIAPSSDTAAVEELRDLFSDTSKFHNSGARVMDILDQGKILIRPTQETVKGNARVLKADNVRKAIVDKIETPVVPEYSTDYIGQRAIGYETARGRAGRLHKGTENGAVLATLTPKDRQALSTAVEAIDVLTNRFKLPLDVNVYFIKRGMTQNKRHDARVGSYWTMEGVGRSKIVIDVDQILDRSRDQESRIGTEADLYQVVAHEFGHYLSAAGILRADPAARAAIFAAYRRQMAAVSRGRISENQFADLAAADPEFRRLGPKYIMKFEEWWAEQVARWMYTDQRPVGVVEKVAKSVADMLRKSLEYLRGKAPVNALRAEPEVENWLNALYDGRAKAFYGNTLQAATDAQTKRANAAVLGIMPNDPRFEGVSPLTLQSVPQRRVLEGLDIEKIEAQAQRQGVTGLNLRGINVAQDRFNRFYKWTLSLPQLAEINDHITPLNEYTELVRRMTQEQQALMIKADDIVRRWTDSLLGKGQSDGLGAFLFDLTEMNYLSPTEKAQGVSRQPSKAEFDALAAKYKLGDPALLLYQEIQDSFTAALGRYIDLLREQAGTISNPAARAERLNDLAITHSRLLSRPYFPMTRYGRWTITVRDAAGKLKYFETFESKRERDSALKRVDRAKDPGDKVQGSILADDYRGLMGLPSLVLEQVTKQVNIPPEVMEQLRYDLSPAQSFRKRFLNRKGVEGYSTDARRNYAHYMFHHSRHFTRAKYGEQLLARVQATRAEKTFRGLEADKIEGIANFMQDHLNEVMNPTEDWSGLRSAMAVFWLGFSPASAIANLSQTPLVTAPFLASKFGDATALAALTRVSRLMKNRYTTGNPSFSAGLSKAVAKAHEEGLIDESRAIELASVAEGATVLSMAAGRESLKYWAQFSSAAMKMFSWAEKFNRIAAFGAAYELATSDPTNAYVRRMPSKYPLEYADLTGVRGWSPAEATAYLAARDTVYKTQFEYGKYARPRFMRGRASALTMFYLFTQNMLFSMFTGGMGRNVRFLLTMAFMGGMMGLPGMEDASDLIKVIAARIFGKEFDLENEARQFVIDHFGDNYLDFAMHGVSRTGFGLPQLAHMMGAQWFPDVDLSGSIGMPNVLPMRLGFLNPGATAERAVYDAVQEGAGPVFGPFFALFNALQGMQTGDLKKWEKAVPRALQGPFRAYRLSQEGFERNSAFQTVTRYDFEDPEQRAELAAIALGFNTTRSRQDWDLRMADTESKQFWQIRRQIIFDQFWQAIQTKQPLGDAREALVKFNKEVPDKTFVIRADAVVRSMMQRAKRNAAAERELPSSRLGAPTTRRMRTLFPDSVEERPLSGFK